MANKAAFAQVTGKSSSKKFTTRNGATFKVDSGMADTVREFGPTSFLSCGNGRRYLRNDNGEYLARVIAKKVYGNVEGKRVSFRDGDPCNLLAKNLLVL